MEELRWHRDVERWMSWVRAGGLVFALFQIGVLHDYYPPGYGVGVWIATGALAAVAAAVWVLSRLELTPTQARALGALALAADIGIVGAFVLLHAFEGGTPIRMLLFIPVVEGAIRYGLRGGVGVPFALLPFIVAFELIRDDALMTTFDPDNITFPFGVQLLTGLIVGWLVERLWRQTEVAEDRAAEAERLRDRLGRRVDLLEAAGRCARALASSLNLPDAFGAFIRELRGLVPFERTAIVLAEGGAAQVMATSGVGADDVFAPGTTRPIEGSLLEVVLRGETVYREDMTDEAYPEEAELIALGLRCRVAAPLLVGARSVGMISVVRAQPYAFTAEEVELLSLLGRFVGTAVQNIRAYDAERNTVEELRRLSALRADFVSLVSHELRSPMATVIGSARTLQQRWRELAPDQRESFLTLIGDETERLATLIGDVLDTSRIEAGTFSYTFDDVDVGALVRDVVASAQLGQDEVPVRAKVADALPPIRGDRERLRQVLANLVDNAVKYSPSGEPVEVDASASNGTLFVAVRDRGPGVAVEDQRLIFEKFGRAKGGRGVPGTGLGLFIARSIAEAHGGSLDVESSPQQGATFRLRLPL